MENRLASTKFRTSEIVPKDIPKFNLHRIGGWRNNLSSNYRIKNSSRKEYVEILKLTVYIINT